MTKQGYRLDHVQVTLPPAAEEAAKQFYGAVLGLEEIPKPPELAGRGGAWYRAGACEVHVSVEAMAPGTNEASRRHVCFVVEDLDAEEARLRAAGVEIVADTQPVAGWRRFYVRDPGGNRVEIATPDRTER